MYQDKIQFTNVGVIDGTLLQNSETSLLLLNSTSFICGTIALVGTKHRYIQFYEVYDGNKANNYTNINDNYCRKQH